MSTVRQKEAAKSISGHALRGLEEAASGIGGSERLSIPEIPIATRVGCAIEAATRLTMQASEVAGGTSATSPAEPRAFPITRGLHCSVQLRIRVDQALASPGRLLVPGRALESSIIACVSGAIAAVIVLFDRDHAALHIRHRQFHHFSREQSSKPRVLAARGPDRSQLASDRCVFVALIESSLTRHHRNRGEDHSRTSRGKRENHASLTSSSPKLLNVSPARSLCVHDLAKTTTTTSRALE